MDREPSFKRQVREWLRWFGFGPREDVLTMTSRSLGEVDKSLSPSKRLDEVMSGESRNTNVVERAAKQIVEEMHDRMDRRRIENLNYTLEASEETYDHAISLQTKSHKLRHLDGALNRREQLDQMEHQARMAETVQRRDKANSSHENLRREAEAETLRTQIAREQASRRYYESQPRPEGRSAERRDEEGESDDPDRQRRASAREYMDGTGLEG
jgi:hypothetical protein